MYKQFGFESTYFWNVIAKKHQQTERERESEGQKRGKIEIVRE